MLKYILFLLAEYYGMLDEEERDGIVSKLHGFGAEAVFQNVDPAGTVVMEGIDRAHTLIVTDNSSVFNLLHGQGYYVIALYHKKNRQQTFQDARYAVENLSELEYRSYEEAFQRLAGLPWSILETNRLKVRESTVFDVEEFYRIYSDPSITYYMEDLFPEKEQEIAYMKAYVDQIYGFYGYGLWTVILKETGKIIGRAGLSVREGYELPELGFVIDVEHQRQGYAFEVCSAILGYAKSELEFEAVQALADENNVASVHLLEKLGFVFDRNVIISDRHYKLFIKKF
ncbi:MAG: GNAT family N-acetyltransferase, partial [Bacillota bacterium]|nr:GNAT family N-acetyltransferase [Bacillota bacterium]